MSTSNYGIEFTETGIVIKDTSLIYADVMADIIAAFNLKSKIITDSEQTPQGQIATSMSDIINNKNLEIVSIANQLDVDKNSGIFQDMLYKIFGLTRNPANPTLVTCTVTGISGITIYGKNETNPSRASDTAGNTYVAQTTTVIGSGGTATVIFENEVGGATACPANSLNSIITSQNGWDTIDNPSDGTVGSDIESNTDFRARYRLLVANNSSGSASALQTAISGLDGVLDVVVRENITETTATFNGYSIEGNHYAISILGGNDTEIAQIILDKKSIASQNGNTTITIVDSITGQSYSFQIIRPTKLSYFVNVELENQASLPSDIVDTVKQAIYDNFYNNRVKIASTTYASRFYKPMLDAYPTLNISLVELASQPEGSTKTAYGSSVVCNLDQYPDLNIDDIVVTFNS